MISLSLSGVADRGTAGLERVQIKVSENCDLGHYWLGVGMKQFDNSIYPINDNLYWLGRGYVTAGDWVSIYTGAGKFSSFNLPNTVNTLYSMYWNRSNVLFKSPEIFPYLIYAQNVVISDEMRSTPQIQLIKQDESS
ncbi:MAG: hypothetical protein KKB02_19990 [Alphaproteobacteria bacterium]|nr:hypothetical protein [Alphaproteobacteria bacterium]